MENVSTKLKKRAIIISRLKRRFLKHIWLARLTVISGVVVIFYLFIVLISLIVRGTQVDKAFSLVKSFLFTPETKIESIEGRTNILILGKGGVGHDAPELTDTIIFASLDHVDSSITLISLPRDIWIVGLRAKLNSAYFWGNQKQADGGIILAKSSVEEIIGTPVHYGVVVDFEGFTNIVDILDGVEVDVEMGFVDEKFPIPGLENDECDGDPEFACRYERIEFIKGSQIMDGDTALKFVRSRNAEGDEGTDIARAARQQKLLSAVKNQVLSPEVFTKPKRALAIWKVVKESTQTDIDADALAILARSALAAKDNLNSQVLSEDFLVNPPPALRYDNLYVFIPAFEDAITGETSWEEVHKWVDSLLP